MKDKFVFYSFVIGVAGAFLGLAVTLSVGLTRDAQRGEATLTWPAVPGRVTDVSRSNNRPALEYRYVVGGRTYTSNRVAFVRRRTLRRGGGLGGYYGRDFSEGESVEVHFDPADPGTAVLLTGVPTSGVVVSGGAIAFLFLIGGGVLWLGLRHPPSAFRHGDDG